MISKSLPVETQVKLMALDECWSDIKGYVGEYVISKSGLVMYVGTNKRYGKKPKSTCLDRGGYVRVTLTLNGKSVQKLLHQLLAEAWLVKPPGAYVVDHIDGNKQNNNLENLRWVSQKENQLNRHTVVASSGATGVHRIKGSKVRPWMACGKVEGRQIYLGVYATRQEAIEARLRWEEGVGARTTTNTGVAL